MNNVGITSAADFKGWSYGPDGRQVWLVRANGRLVAPVGIGEIKAEALAEWRRKVGAPGADDSTVDVVAGVVRWGRGPVRPTTSVVGPGKGWRRIVSETPGGQGPSTPCSHRERHRSGSGRDETGFTEGEARLSARLDEQNKTVQALVWRRARCERELEGYTRITYRRFCRCGARGFLGVSARGRHLRG